MDGGKSMIYAVIAFFVLILRGPPPGD